MVKGYLFLFVVTKPPTIQYITGTWSFCAIRGASIYSCGPAYNKTLPQLALGRVPSLVRLSPRAGGVPMRCHSQGMAGLE